MADPLTIGGRQFPLLQSQRRDQNLSWLRSLQSPMRRSPSLQLSSSNPCRCQPESWTTPTTMMAARTAHLAAVLFRISAFLVTASKRVTASKKSGPIGRGASLRTNKVPDSIVLLTDRTNHHIGINSVHVRSTLR